MTLETSIRSSQQIGKLIAAARRRKHLTQRDVARELGVTQAWISRVERGQQKAWIGLVLRLAAWLDLEIVGKIQEAQPVKRRTKTAYPDINEIANG